MGNVLALASALWFGVTHSVSGLVSGVTVSFCALLALGWGVLSADGGVS